MSIKKLVAVMVAVVALTAVAASSASAAVETKAAEWYTGASPGTTLAGDLAATLTGEGTLESKVAETPVALKSTELECVGCQITNAEVTSKAGKVAIGKGQIRFKNVVVETPANCTAQGINADGTFEAVGTITTRPLVIHADFMDTNTGNQKDFAQFLPVTGSIFAGVHLAGTSCGVAGNYNVTGSVFSESVNATNIQATTQKAEFNKEVQATTGASLKFGANAATLTGSATFAAGGTPFGIH